MHIHPTDRNVRILPVLQTHPRLVENVHEPQPAIRIDAQALLDQPVKSGIIPFARPDELLAVFELVGRCVCVDERLFHELEHDFSHGPDVGADIDGFVAVGFVGFGVEVFLGPRSEETARENL